MKPISKIAASVSPSATLAVNALAKKLKAEGKDVISFGTGEPDFPTPDPISYAGIRAICDGQTKYTPAAGTISLRKAVCARVKEDYDLDYDETQVVIASGAKHVVYLALAVLVDPGDEVILPAPYWTSYFEMIRLFNGVPVVVSAGEDQGFKITAEQLEAAITPKTKAIMLNNPSNPTGAIYTKQELEALAAVCVKHDLYIIADEIYDKLVYDGAAFISIPTLGADVKEHTILINGVSKTYAMTGWRVGYAIGPNEVIRNMIKFQENVAACVNSAAQFGAIAALESGQECVSMMRESYERRRALITSEFETVPGLKCHYPKGAFYAMIDVSATGMTGKEFALDLLDKNHVIVVPGNAFGEAGKNYVRISFATSDENIVKAVKILAETIDEFLK